jgi:3D (Asp-Asp-Asp) domain-containing protein
MKNLKYYLLMPFLCMGFGFYLLFTSSLFFLKEFKGVYKDQNMGLQRMPIPKVTNNLKFESINAIVTAYEAEEAQTDSSPFLTASGYDLRGGKNVIANNCLDFGSAVILNGKTYFVEDRLASRYGCQYFDVYMPSGAKEFGKQFINLTILR